MRAFPTAKTALAGTLMAALMSVPLWSAAAPSERRNASEQARFDQSKSQEQAALRKTRKLLDDKLELRRGELKSRVRALYKLNRSTWPRVWMEPEARREASRWLGAGRRIINRDLREIDILHDEISLAERAQERLDASAASGLAAGPAVDSLQSPLQDTKIVAKPGDYKELHSRARLRRRGVELRSKHGDRVRPVAPGTVVYAGPISGRDTGVVIDHGGYYSVTASLESATVEMGERVELDATLGRAQSTSLYLELRLDAGLRHHPLDPVDYLKL